MCGQLYLAFHSVNVCASVSGGLRSPGHSPCWLSFYSLKIIKYSSNTGPKCKPINSSGIQTKEEWKLSTLEEKVAGCARLRRVDLSCIFVLYEQFKEFFIGILPLHSNSTWGFKATGSIHSACVWSSLKFWGEIHFYIKT